MIVADGERVLDLAITEGSPIASSPSNPFLPEHAGKRIVLQPTPTTRQVLTILQVLSAASILMSGEASATQTASIAHFGTDQRDALQSVINGLAANEGGRYVLPRGMILVLGKLQDPAGANSMLVVPPRYQPSAPLTVAIEGAHEPGTGYWGSVQVGNGQPQHTTGTILYCPEEGSGTAPGIIGTNSINKVGTGPIPPNFDIGFSTTALSLRNLTIRGKANPSLDAVQWTKGGNIIVENVVCDIDYWNSRTPDPLSGGAFALRLPADGNNGMQMLRNVYIHGYRAAIRPGEHFDADNIFIQTCRAGLYADEQLGPHGKRIGRMVIQETTIPVECNGHGLANLHIDVLNIEQSAISIQNSEQAWTDSSVDWSDPSNLCSGRAGVVKLRQTGAPTTFAVDGGNGMCFRHLGTGVDRMGGFYAHGLRQLDSGLNYFWNQVDTPAWWAGVYAILGGGSSGDFVFRRKAPVDDVAGCWRGDTGELVAFHGIRHGAPDGAVDVSGSGAPTLDLPQGSTYRRLDPGAPSAFYVNETGGPSGWVAK